MRTLGYVVIGLFMAAVIAASVLYISLAAWIVITFSEAM